MAQYTADQLALKAHIEAENEKFVEQCKASGAQCWFTTTSDLDHWADCDVRTIEEYERYSLIATISDMSKELHGFRVRYNWDAMSMEDLQREYDSYIRAHEIEAEYEAKREAERKASIQQRNKEFRDAGNAMALAFAKAKEG